MKKNLILLFFTFTFFNSFSQTEYKMLIQKADSLQQIKSYKESLFFYKKAFELKESSNIDFYSAACSSALAGDQEHAFLFLNKAIDNGWSNMFQLKEDRDLIGLHSQKEWVKIITKAQRVAEKKSAQYDKPLYNELLQIYEDD